MGFEFKSEEERNPTKQPLLHEQLQAQKVNPCEALQLQLDEINQFIDENGLLKHFYMWQELKIQLRDTSAEVIDDKVIE